MYTLDNGLELNKEFPDSFYIPSKNEIEKLAIGDYVKLIFREEKSGVERMWVKIVENPLEQNGKRQFIGLLDNDPYKLKTIRCGDVIEFLSDHIIQIAE